MTERPPTTDTAGHRPERPIYRPCGEQEQHHDSHAEADGIEMRLVRDHRTNRAGCLDPSWPTIPSAGTRALAADSLTVAHP
jgi:hypothetical protein